MLLWQLFPIESNFTKKIGRWCVSFPVAEPQKQEEAKRTALATTIPQYVNSPDEPKKRVSRTPIIIIPSAMTSLLTIFNATDIIQVLYRVGYAQKASLSS